MTTGTIVTLRGDRGFGFISAAEASSNGSEIFFHRSAVADGEFEDLREGETVTLDTEPDPRHPSRSCAVNVRVTPAVPAEAE